MELSLRNMKVLNLNNKQHTPSMLAYYMYHLKKNEIKYFSNTSLDTNFKEVKSTRCRFLKQMKMSSVVYLYIRYL